MSPAARVTLGAVALFAVWWLAYFFACMVLGPDIQAWLS